MHITHTGVKIVSAMLTSEGKIEIIRQYASNQTYLNGKPVPDKVVKEVYSATDGKIVLEKEIYGVHTPGFYQAESISFEANRYDG